MAEENTKEEAPFEPFKVGDDWVEKDSYGGKIVERDSNTSLPHWVGDKKIERNVRKEAIKMGDKEIGRNSQTGKIESLGGKPLDWKTAENLGRFLDGQ